MDILGRGNIMSKGMEEWPGVSRELLGVGDAGAYGGGQEVMMREEAGEESRTGVECFVYQWLYPTGDWKPSESFRQENDKAKYV